VGKVYCGKKEEVFLMEVLESLFARALKLESPWEITKIEFHEGDEIIKVFVDFPRGSVFSCPACGKDVKGSASPGMLPITPVKTKSYPACGDWSGRFAAFKKRLPVPARQTGPLIQGATLQWVI
jgi:hypothetical protein